MIYFDFNKNKFVSTVVDSSLSQHSISLSPSYFEVPGFTKEDITAEIIEKNVLKILGSTEKYGSTKKFNKILYLPKNVDDKTVEVKVENGMLIIEYKLAEGESRKISIK